MLTLDCEQGSAEWLEARLGVPTASQFSRIVTPTGRLSAQRDEYMAELLAEYFLGEPVKDFSSEWTEYGRTMEPRARAYYEFIRDQEVRKVGLIYRDDSRSVGASPDGLVGAVGGLELKCPAPHTHLLYLARDACPRVYVPQVQGQIWVGRLSWVDFMSYCPQFPELIVRVEPDEKYQAGLDEHMPVFVGELREARERLIDMGVEPPPAPVQTRERAPAPPPRSPPPQAHEAALRFQAPL